MVHCAFAVVHCAFAVVHCAFAVVPFAKFQIQIYICLRNAPYQREIAVPRQEGISRPENVSMCIHGENFGPEVSKNNSS